MDSGRMESHHQHQSFGSHLGLLICDAVDGEPSLHIVDQTEVLTGLLNADDICQKTTTHTIIPSLSYKSMCCLDFKLTPRKYDFPISTYLFYVKQHVNIHSIQDYLTLTNHHLHQNYRSIECGLQRLAMYATGKPTFTSIAASGVNSASNVQYPLLFTTVLPLGLGDNAQVTKTWDVE